MSCPQPALKRWARMSMRLAGWAVLLWAMILAHALAQASQPFPQHAGLVVQFGDGEVITACVDLGPDGEAPGEEVLRASGLAVVMEYVPGAGGAVCKIGGEGCDFPNESCFCRCALNPNEPCIYWSYYHLTEGQWQFSNIGASNYTVGSGDVEGWAWGPGAIGAAGAVPPSLTFEDICVPPTPTPSPSPTATPTATPPPTATWTPSPTYTPTATLPTPTGTPTPTDTPVPARTGTPTNTPQPTATPVPTSTTAPTRTTDPSGTPRPTRSATPTSSPTATLTAVPTSTFVRSATAPPATATSAPTATVAAVLTLTSPQHVDTVTATHTSLRVPTFTSTVEPTTPAVPPSTLLASPPGSADAQQLALAEGLATREMAAQAAPGLAEETGNYVFFGAIVVALVAGLIALQMRQRL